MDRNRITVLLYQHETVLIYRGCKRGLSWISTFGTSTEYIYVASNGKTHCMYRKGEIRTCNKHSMDVQFVSPTSLSVDSAYIPGTSQC
jgi:hypothetical protein